MNSWNFELRIGNKYFRFGPAIATEEFYRDIDQTEQMNQTNDSIKKTVECQADFAKNQCKTKNPAHFEKEGGMRKKTSL